MYERARKALLGQLGAMDPPSRRGGHRARERRARRGDRARRGRPVLQDGGHAALRPHRGVIGRHAPQTPTDRGGLAAEDDAAASVSAVRARKDRGGARSRSGRASGRLRRRRPSRAVSTADSWILGGVVAIVVAAVAAAALKLRNSPDELARLKPVAAPTAETTASGKIAERVGRDDSPVTAPPHRLARHDRPAAPATSAKAAGTDGDAGADSGRAARGAARSRRPTSRRKVRTFLGSTVWRLDNVPTVSGQPLGTAVHADVECRKRRSACTLDLRKNTDPALPASEHDRSPFHAAAGQRLPRHPADQPCRRCAARKTRNGDSLAGRTGQDHRHLFPRRAGAGRLRSAQQRHHAQPWPGSTYRSS